LEAMTRLEPEIARSHHRRILTDRSGDTFRPLEPDCKVVQFNRPLPADELRKAAELMRNRPDVQLYIYDPACRNLDFLGYFGNLRRLQLGLYELEDISGLSTVGRTLEELTFGSTRRSFSLRILESLPRLRCLFLAGHKRDLAAVQTLKDITRLGLSGLTLPDLSIILPLARLSDLSIMLGGTSDLGLLPSFPALESLMLMRITRMSDLGVLANLPSLRSLHLDWMRNVTALPSLAPLHRLEKIKLDTMKGLSDLSPIAAAPSLRELIVTSMPQLKAESFRCLVGHPHLRKLSAQLGRNRVNEEIKRMFPGVAA